MESDYSRQSLLGFIDYVQTKGLVPNGRARAWRTAVTQILTDLSPSEEADIRNADLGAAMTRFINRHPLALTPKSTADYRRRLPTVIDNFTSWKNDPAGYRAVAPRKRAMGRIEPKGEGVRRNGKSASDHLPITNEARSNPTPKVALMSERTTSPELALPFPIRADFTAQLLLPRDLTVEEARRLGAFVLTLAADFRPDAL
jgi:hypothetical protein